MKKIFLFFFITISLSGVVEGMAVGIVPDKIEIDAIEGNAKSFRIVNPNKESIGFNVVTESIKCTPINGVVNAESGKEVVCTAEGESREELILVETTQEGDSVGVMPAVAVKVEVKGERATSKQASTPLEIDSTKSRPVKTSKIEDSKKEEIEEKEDTNIFKMTPELWTVAFLTVAILVVLGYSEFRDRKRDGKDKKIKKHKADTNDLSASSIPDAQADLSSASASASQHLPSKSHAHDEKAQNQLSLFPGR